MGMFSTTNAVPGCPRCRQQVDFHAGGAIKPHRDELTDEPCPAEGLTLAEARVWIANLRAEMEDRVRATLKGSG